MYTIVKFEVLNKVERGLCDLRSYDSAYSGRAKGTKKKKKHRPKENVEKEHPANLPRTRTTHHK